MLKKVGVEMIEERREIDYFSGGGGGGGGGEKMGGSSKYI